MKYEIEITETNSMVITLDAKSESEAIHHIKSSYENGEIELTDENAFVDVTFNIV